MPYEIYQNAPLVETVYEIKFPQEPALVCKRDVFFEKIRDICPSVDSFDKYENKDKSIGVMTAIDKLAIYSNKYKGFKNFKKDVLNIFHLFDEIFKIEKFNRSGLRYINIIPFIREEGKLPLKNYFNMNVNFSENIPRDFLNFKFMFITQMEEGQLTTRIESVISQDRKEEAFILDFDFSFTQEGELEYNLVDKYLDESHKHTKLFFEELITENYKKVMRGELV